MPEEAVTMGVEEEYQLVDPLDYTLRSEAPRLLDIARPVLGDNIDPELFLSQVEIHTDVCQSLAELRVDLRRKRRAVIEVAEKIGIQVAAAGTHPFSSWEDQRVYPKRRYINLLDDYGDSFHEQVVFGSHVHIGIADPDALIQTMNRVRPWLPTIIALTANSPFWLGKDTGYASYRTDVWSRWPTACTPGVLASRAEYETVIGLLIAGGGLREPTKLYWDVRPSHRFPTLEFRVADVCLTVDEAVMMAGLCRALARMCHDAAIADTPYPQPRPEVLQHAKWRAARDGLDGRLVDVCDSREVQAAVLVRSFLEWLHPALEAHGDWAEVSELVGQTLTCGNGAKRQRRLFERTHSLPDVMRFVVIETGRGVRE